MSKLIRKALALVAVAALLLPAAALAAAPTPPALPDRSADFAPGGLGRVTGGLPARGAAATAAADPADANPVDRWSRMAFQSYRGGSWDIFSMRPDGTELRQLTSGAGSDGRPQQSRADGRIVFVSNRTGNYEIFSMAPDGSDLRQLTHDPAEDNYPTWSPDGRRIAFASTRCGSWDILVMNADGSDVQVLNSTPGVEFGPAWSPDGQWVAFIRMEKSQGRIWLVHGDGTGLHATSSYNRYPENLAWSPDSKFIAFDYDVGDDYFTDLAYIQVDLSEWIAATQIYRPAGELTDALMGGWSPDGKEFLFSQVQYVIIEDELLIQRADLGRLARYNSYDDPPSFLSGSGADMLADWQSTDHTRPYSRLALLPRLGGPDGVQVAWSGVDGESGIAGFDFQVRKGGDWFPWQYSGHENSEFVYGRPGERVDVRVRARDAAGNVEDWPSAAQGDGSILFYADRRFGYVFDLRETPIPGALVEGVRNPDIPVSTAADGAYDAYSFETIPSLRVTHPAYGTLPELRQGLNTMPRYDVTLPPKVDAVTNGGFEAGLDGWSIVSGQAEAMETDTYAHSGRKVLKLTAQDPGSTTAAVSQVIEVPLAAAHPTLSFFARPWPGLDMPLDRVRATVMEVSGAAAPLTLNLRPTPTWTHVWADLSPWGGKRVTLTLEVKLKWIDTFGSAAFEEVSLGEWRTPRIDGADGPRERPGALIVRGENFERGAVVTVDGVDLATTFVDSGTLTAEAGARARTGVRPLWVTNPGGEQALGSVLIGKPVYLPVVTYERQ